MSATYTANDVARTAYDAAVYGENQTCPCCKNPNTETLQGVEAIPWRDFFKTFIWRAFGCSMCGAKFSWFRRTGYAE